MLVAPHTHFWHLVCFVELGRAHPLKLLLPRSKASFRYPAHTPQGQDPPLSSVIDFLDSGPGSATEAG